MDKRFVDWIEARIGGMLRKEREILERSSSIPDAEMELQANYSRIGGESLPRWFLEETVPKNWILFAPPRMPWEQMMKWLVGNPKFTKGMGDILGHSCGEAIDDKGRNVVICRLPMWGIYDCLDGIAECCRKFNLRVQKYSPRRDSALGQSAGDHAHGIFYYVKK